jgi:hypothetical protein
MGSAQPTFLFYRSLPDEPTTAALASSLQGLETSFFLVSLRRYPHALTVCASAIESILKHSPACEPLMKKSGKTPTLNDLIQAVRDQSPSLRGFPHPELDQFRQARNRIVHKGFSPKDDSESAELLIRVGFPFAASCLQQLHSFDLMDSLIVEHAYHLEIARRVYEKARSLAGEFTYCFRSFGHYLQWCFRDNFLANWESDALEGDDVIFIKGERIDSEKNALERRFDASWDHFSCPICGDWDSTLVELDADALEESKVVPLRMACFNCGFTVRIGQLFLSETLLEPQVIEQRSKILKDFGYAD